MAAIENVLSEIYEYISASVKRSPDSELMTVKVPSGE
jgi:hypothetical protein